jgi:NAD+-dependent protein deacetylase sirtuin 4
MGPPLLRIPFQGPLPAPRILPRNGNTRTGAIAALTNFLTAPPPSELKPSPHRITPHNETVILSGAGISVASGLADYRGENGTYTLNKTYRPVYFHEFTASHTARRRYWARSFLGWASLKNAKPNVAHYAVGQLGQLGIVGGVITQSMS